MSYRTDNLENILTGAKIYNPDSETYLKQEKSLTRYLEKEYSSYLQNPITLESTGISTDRGPIMDQTDELMETHYDESIELFMGFLDTSYRAYTMAYYGEDGTDEITLEQAQQQKFKLITERAHVKPGDRILNIGCGFGSLETYLLQEFPGVETVGITPSKTQIDYLREKMADPGHPLSDGFTLIEDVFDEDIVAKLGEDQFDLVISIGVFEQLLNMKLMLKLISQLLKPGGHTFHHFITSRVVTPQVKLDEKTVIGKYFPGGRIWPADEFARHTEHLDFIDSWFINGKNYWRTLDEWHHRYWRSIPDLYGTSFDLDAIKHWNEYFMLCKAMFAPLDGSFYGNTHYLFKAREH